MALANGADAQAALLALARGQGPGQRNQRRTESEMLWGEETPGRTDQFTPKQLPSAKFLDPEHTALAGVSAADPEVDPQPDAAGRQESTNADARSAWRRRIAPAHREAVKRFFAPIGGEEKR